MKTYNDNITVLALPVCSGKTDKAIEYAVKAALTRKIAFITFDENLERLATRFKRKVDELFPDNLSVIKSNLHCYNFNQPINSRTIDKIILEISPSGIVFDGLEWFKGKSQYPWELEKEFTCYAKRFNGPTNEYDALSNRKYITFFVTKQLPRNEWTQ